MKTYREIYEAPKRFKSDKWDHYLDIYERHFARFRDGRPLTYLEIGVQNGGSLCVAREYFGSQAMIYGLDIDPACKVVEQAGIANQVFIGSQSDPSLLATMLAEMGRPPDIIVDDGSHVQVDMVESFLTLFPAMAADGCYIIEDTHTVFYHSHQESRSGLNVYDYFKSLSDKMMQDFQAPGRHRERFRLPPQNREGRLGRANAIGAAIGGLHFYNSMIVVEKAPYWEPWRRNV